VLYSRQVLQELDGFLTECGNIGEDIDLSYRLVQKGHRLIYIAGCVVIHRMRATPKTWIRNMALYGKGRIQFTIRHPGAIKYWVFLPMALVLVLLSVPFSFIYPFYIFLLDICC
jgi:GT2 family glycosyltransferase